MKLTREEKCERIAQACDWDFDPIEAHGWKSRGRWVKHPKLTDGKLVFRHSIPDYFASLDACHEMEKVMTKEHAERYSDILSNTPQTQEWAGCTMWHFTAEDKAEAFGLALGLWQPGE